MKQTAVTRPIRLLAALVLVVGSLPFASGRAAAAVCGDVQVVWARGSGVAIGGPDFRKFYTDEFDARVGPEISHSAYQLGEGGGFGGFSYPAVGEDGDLLRGPLLPRLPGNPFWDSVEQGRAELVAYLTDRAAVCPNEVFVLGGWSQGAIVIGEDRAQRA